MLARGTYKQIARAAWKNPPIRRKLVKLMAKEVEKETSQLCSKKEPSCVRITDKENISSFTIKKVAVENKDRAPLFHSLLSAACISSRSRDKKDSQNSHYGAVAVAAAICLKNRSRYMTAVQLLITVFLYTHIDKRGFVTGVLLHPDGSHCSPSGVKTPVTKRPLIYVCKRKTWFDPVTKRSHVFVYKHRLSVFVIELFFC